MKMLCGVMILFGVMLGCPVRSAAEDDAAAKQIFDHVLQTYKTAKTFSCDGDYESDSTSIPPLNDKITFKIVFSRPGLFRMDWTETKMGGDVVTNSIFTRDGALYFYWPLMNKYAKQKSIPDIIGTNAGISRGLSYEIPSLLLGENGYFRFVSLKQEPDVTVEGAPHFSLAGKDGRGNSYEIAIDKVTYTIVQVKQVELIKGSTVADAKKEMAKTNPEIAKNMPDLPPMPDFTVTSTTTYRNISFGRDIPVAEFNYEVPPTAQFVDNLLK